MLKSEECKESELFDARMTLIGKRLKREHTPIPATVFFREAMARKPRISAGGNRLSLSVLMGRIAEATGRSKIVVYYCHGYAEACFADTAVGQLIAKSPECIGVYDKHSTKSEILRRLRPYFANSKDDEADTTEN